MLSIAQGQIRIVFDQSYKLGGSALKTSIQILYYTLTHPVGPFIFSRIYPNVQYSHFKSH